MPDEIPSTLVAADWEGDVRTHFHRLYVLEDKKLPQVMDEMTRLLGFRAT